MNNNDSNLKKLAIFSGQPAFLEMLHVGRPNIGNREHLLARINDMLDRRWLTNKGQYVIEFEKRVADFLGVKHCVAMCNGTVALEIATRALGLKGEVIVPSFTFVATAHALQWQEITPVFCDIDPLTHTIDPNRVEEMITPRTTGIMGVHLWGRPCDTDHLAEIARKRNLHLLFDASHAFGASHQGKMIGNFGEIEVFSFHATKFMNTFEGGAVVTNNDELADKMRLMKNFGFSGYDSVIYIGTNGKMAEVTAAMGLTNLESLEQFIALNQRNYQSYKDELERVPGVSLISYNKREKCNYQYVVLEVDEDTAGLHRDLLLKILHAENVLARRYFYPGCHRMEPYRSYFPHSGLLLPQTERLSGQVLILPTGTTISPEEIRKICAIIRTVVENSEAVRTQITQV
ncbi:MAG: dTDP-4-dehydro-6-deoxyglucose aminotransferase [Thiotrichaceae bacterium IS1]|nr:MAG: dTDP-4-dehydro-6-deoxyglucose aminotransferase [Thiotrichaceae bacterium IS1]